MSTFGFSVQTSSIKVAQTFLRVCPHLANDGAYEEPCGACMSFLRNLGCDNDATLARAFMDKAQTGQCDVSFAMTGRNEYRFSSAICNIRVHGLGSRHGATQWTLIINVVLPQAQDILRQLADADLGDAVALDGDEGRIPIAMALDRFAAVVAA